MNDSNGEVFDPQFDSGFELMTRLGFTHIQVSADAVHSAGGTERHKFSCTYGDVVMAGDVHRDPVCRSIRICRCKDCTPFFLEMLRTANPSISRTWLHYHGITMGDWIVIFNMYGLLAPRDRR